jgi:hypothetical protein
VLRGSGRLKWRAPLPSRPLSGPILVGDAILVACRDFEVIGIDGRSGKSLGTIKTAAEIKTEPLLVSDRLYVGLRDRSLIAYRLDMTAARPTASPSPGGPGHKGDQTSRPLNP